MLNGFIDPRFPINRVSTASNANTIRCETEQGNIKIDRFSSVRVFIGRYSKNQITVVDHSFVNIFQQKYIYKNK